MVGGVLSGIGLMLFYYKFCKYILALNQIEINELAPVNIQKYTASCDLRGEGRRDWVAG